LPPSSAPALDPADLYTSSFWTISASHFLLGMGFWMFTLFPLHLANLGAGKATIGLVFALEPIAAILVRPAVGALLSVRGRTGLFRAGGLLNLAGVASYAVVDGIGPMLVLVRLVHGIGIGTLFATFFTYAADITPPARRTEGLAVFGVSGMLPSAFAPILGEEMALRYGFPAMFVAAAAFTLGSLILAWSLPEPEAGEGGDARSFWRLAIDPFLRPVWLTTFSFSAAMAAYFAFLAPFAHSVGLGRVGPFFFWYSIAAVTLRIAGRTLPDRVGARRMLLPPLASLAVGLYLLSHLDSMTRLSAAGVLCGMGQGFLFPILNALAVEGVDRRSRGNAISLFTALFDAGQMIGPIILGVIAERAGYPSMFLVASATVMATLALWMPAVRRKERHA
jgi:MFS family permease